MYKMDLSPYKQILVKYWGHTSFRPLQEEIIRSVAEGRDTLALMPTGGGKSITFQVPALAKEGICIVISPLIALMKDQVDRLNALGIKSMAVHSGMSAEEIDIALDNCVYGSYKFLYISPERIATKLFQARVKMMAVNLVAVDEAHCISQWGYDFRPSYLKIAEIRQLLEGVPVLALTATATADVIDDIQEKLLFKEKNVLRATFARDNLSYVVRAAENKEGELNHILQSVPGTSIVYVRSRRKTKEIAKSIRQAGISADFFHAGLSYEDKIFKQNAWRIGDCRVIVATNAFGMGIDKPDVRTVIHMDLPDSLEEYFQEAGRAGRDGNRSYAILLYSKSDSVKLKKRISDSFPDRKFIARVYEALGNFYQVAVGAGYNNVYDFNLYEFCAAYRLPSLQTHHALKILELAGYIEYTEEIDARSRLRFLIFRDEMYSLRLSKELDELLHSILRSYTGVFSDDVYIDESLLATRVGKSREEVYDMLKTLSRLRYIHYVPAKKTPFIVFATSREDIQFVSIPRAVLEKRRKRFEKRIHSMVDYAEESEVCRSRMLLIYFGEERATDCGHCDVCLRKSESGLTNFEFRQLEQGVREVLQDGCPKRINQVVGEVENAEAGHSLVVDTKSEKLLSVIRFLIDAGVLLLEDDTVCLREAERRKPEDKSTKSS